MIEFKRRELEFKLDEVTYKLKFPTVKQTAEYAKNHDKSDDKFDEVLTFLEMLGLEKAISEEMEVPHLETIISELTKAKK